MPLLEGLGFRVIDERTYSVTATGTGGGTIWLHDMTLERAAGGPIDIAAIDPRIEAALMALFHGLTESDRLNALILEAGLAWREAAMLLRTLSRYAQQIRAPYGQDYIAETLKKHAGAAAALVGCSTPASGPMPAAIAPRRKPRLRRRSRPNSRPCRASTRIVSSGSSATCCRQRCAPTSTSSTKTAGRASSSPSSSRRRRCRGCAAAEALYEIFLHSPRVEGVHMRFGKVARGGIRWSDRPQDFRTEVLGLVKAQQVKNAVIVPVGAKGGFVPKLLPRPPIAPPGWRRARNPTRSSSRRC